MDDGHKPAGAAGLPLQGPHRVAARGDETPVGFKPLRLVLQPSGWTIQLTQAEMVLGRHTSADVRLPLPDVSRRHCRFLFTDGRWQVFDLDSLNGVWVNGEQVRQAVLHHQDRLRLGGFTFQVELHPGDQTVEVPSAAVLHQISEALPPAERRAS